MKSNSCENLRSASRLAGLVAIACLLFAFAAAAQDESFFIRDIRVEGLQRLELGTVLTYLPVAVGDELTPQRSQQALRALYETGLFEDVSLAREGDALIVRVEERPEIASFNIEGNKKLGGDEIKENLAEAGLAEGELFRRALLDSVELELRRQYYANGYYAVEIESTVTPEEGNRVRIDIDVTEGPVAEIRDINIVGNDTFTDEELREVFELDTSKPLLFFQSSDKYSKEKLLGDLESLGSFYQDRGYLRFNVRSIQVSLSPDRRDIFLTVNVDEGAQYTVSEYRFAGELIVPEQSLNNIVSVAPGQIFSRRQVTATADRISAGLADVGYAFAKVEPLTKIDDENREVSLTFFVDPGRRAYVRRIEFSGNAKTNDETLRREMRQLEGATFSRRAVERSRTRLARLPFIADATVETEPVPGSDDLVDVDFNVTERPAGTIQFGVGFSDAAGFLINGNITNTNFRGTGNRVNVQAETNEFATLLAGSWTDPYATDDGISRTISAFFRDSEQVIRFGSGFDLNSLGVALTYGIPISEFSAIRLGVGVENNEITSALIPGLLSNEIIAFAQNNGTEFTTYELRTGLSRDTRNSTLFATSGSLTRLNFDVAVPGSDIEFYSAVFDYQKILQLNRWLPIPPEFILEFKGRVGYAEPYGDAEDIPPYENFFAGGATSVRGFQDGSLGPRDTPFNNPFGGTFLVTGQTELVIPTPLETDNKSTRFSLFYDFGNVFAEPDDFETRFLRSSGGVAFYWFTPFFGLLRVSYAAFVEDGRDDEVDRFQISFGVGL